MTNIKQGLPFMEPIDATQIITSTWYVVRTICFLMEAVEFPHIQIKNLKTGFAWQ